MRLKIGLNGDRRLAENDPRSSGGSPPSRPGNRECRGDPQALYRPQGTQAGFTAQVPRPSLRQGRAE